MFILGTIYVASNARTIELGYVRNRNFPGGPAQYSYYIYSEPITIVGLVAFFGANWMCDALLVGFSWFSSSYILTLFVVSFIVVEIVHHLPEFEIPARGRRISGSTIHMLSLYVLFRSPSF